VTLTGIFIRRPVATTLLSLAIVLAGALAFTLLPVAPLPRVEFPTINVNANLPGASPETMASAVATPLERRFGRIAGISEITSTSSLGATNITLQFDLARNVESAARDVQAAIAAAGGELPSNLPARPTYRKVNPADAPIMVVSLTSDTLPLAQVFDAANTVLVQKLSRVDGVGQVFVGGGQQPAVRVQVDPDALAGVGLGLEDVRNRLSQATANSPKGALSGGGQTRAIAANDQLFGADAFRNLVIGLNAGAPVRLVDVARVFDDVENDRAAAWSNGARSVLLIIRREPGANILETNARIRELLPSLAAAISPAIHVQVAVDRTQSIRASVQEVERALVLSVLLVVAVVFLFLRNLRATFIPSAAVPLSLIGTFAVMKLLDYSIDNLSLMALTVATGFVVDDAIVVTENVTRFLEQGRSPRQAALEGARQIGFTILSITASLIAVFLPILLMGGVVGRLFREFAVTLSVAITISAAVSLSLTPMLCSRLLRAEPAQQSRLVRALERGFDGLQRGYLRALDWVLDHQRLMQGVTVATLFASVALFIAVPKGLFPQQDTGLLMGFAQAPQDVSFATMRERTKAVNDIVSADPDVDRVVSFTGGGSSTSNTGTAFVSLKPKPQRQSTPDEVIARLRPKLAAVSGINLFLQAAQDMRVGGRPSRTQYQYTLQDIDLAELNSWAPRLKASLGQLKELTDVASDQQNAGLQLSLDMDRDTIARLGLSPSIVDNVLYDAYGQRQVATSFTQLNEYRVVMEVAPAFAAGPSGLDHLYVSGAGGAQVPLRALATTRVEGAPVSVNHQGQFPSITLSFNLAPGVALGDAVEAIHRAELALGLPPTIKASFSGTAQAFNDSLSSQPFLIGAALLTVYIVLGVLYESYAHPLTILSTLPSAGLGALIALWVSGTDLNIIALIGIVLLIGIVKKNAILMIDFALEAEREHGAAPIVAVREACRLRFRPILMTTLAALLGALPLALGTGAGSELRHPLGLTIIGGLLVSQLLTLFTTPIVYLTLDRFAERRRTRKQRRATTRLQAV
jgi:hydrophobic/amphiphilic exporter-1 (mainly G- bacteria), HAE1 family